MCLMTEVQLQSLLEKQGDPDTGFNPDIMTTPNGEKISKFDLRACTIGKDVSEDIRHLFFIFSRRYVGNDSVFPTESGAPRVLTAFKNRPYRFELRDEYVKGPKPKPLPTVRATYNHGKPATRKILEHFVRTTPVVSRCDHPRCLSRLVIVPKRDPGTPKDSPPTGYRVTMNALINSCIKPVASVMPLATDEIKKLHHYKYYLQLDGSQAFWSIPLDEESKKLLAFQTHEGVFAWDRLTMGAQPSSSVQQSAYHEALDKYIPAKYRHRFALMADDIAAGANTIEELFDLYKVLIECLDAAGIQVKAQKLKFGIKEIKFHNYKISEEITTIKEENLEPIRQMGIPTSVTEVKAFLGCCGQMANYCQWYAIMAEPLHSLTRKINRTTGKPSVFPRPWLPGTDYDLAFHRLKSRMLDGPLFLWNKVSTKRLFIEVDSSQDGWGACAYQYADIPPPECDDEGRYRLLNKSPKRVIAWISKAHTEHEKKLPCFYRETLARLLALQHFRNLIETQDPKAGTTVYTDHLPSLKEASLSNKGQLSTWRIHETADLNSVVQTLHRKGITMIVSDGLSRIKRKGCDMEMVLLPLVFKELLTRLPDGVRKAEHIRVSAERDTVAAARIVQRWREPKNVINTLKPENPGNYQFLIAATYADKVTHRVANLLRKGKQFAFLVPTSLINDIPRTADGQRDEAVAKALSSTAKIVLTAMGHTWIINHDSYRDQPKNLILYNEDQDIHLDNHLMLEGKPWKHLGKALHELDRLMKNDKPCQLQSVRSDKTATRTSAKRAHDARQNPKTLPQSSPKRPRIEKADYCLVNTRSMARRLEPQRRDQEQDHNPSPSRPNDNTANRLPNRSAAKRLTVFGKADPADSYDQWVGQQPTPAISDKLTETELPKEYPQGLKAYTDTKGNVLIPVPKEQRIRLINMTHQTLLHVNAERVWRDLSTRFWWPNMKILITEVCKACRQCQLARIRRKHLSIPYTPKQTLHLPRQSYGIDFYGHKKGNILVAIDLCSREVILWFTPTRSQEQVAKCLLSGLIFQKGVPLYLRSDAASEFIKGVVEKLNNYLGIQHVSTGGYNPRANAIVERFMQTLNSMLRKFSAEDYRNINLNLQAIAFAHNTTYNSVIECTPFECGHGLRARTISDARMSPRLQYSTEEGMEGMEGITTKWDATVPHKVLELATRMADIAQQNSEWHRKMSSNRLNQAGKPINPNGIPSNSKVYFYKPPTQAQVEAKGRMAKHLHHYVGPATIVGKVKDKSGVERSRSYEIAYTEKNDKGDEVTTTFYRDEAMIVPACDMPKTEDIRDPADAPKPKPRIYDALAHNDPLREGEYIICKDSPSSKDWYLAEVWKVLPDKIEVKYFSTRTPALENYNTRPVTERINRLQQTLFRRTWFFLQGEHAGKGTVKPPYPNNEDLRVWSGPLPSTEHDKVILIRGAGITGTGKLCKETLSLASRLDVPHAVTPVVEGEKSTPDPNTYYTLSGRDMFNVHIVRCNDMTENPTPQ